MPNKTVHCKICHAPISGSTFKERMAKIRRHYKKYHPAAFARMIRKAVATKAAKTNPGIAGAVIEKAKKMFKGFHQFDPTKFTRVKIKSRQIPKRLVFLGYLVDLAYSSDKWHKGKRVNYLHKFKHRPILATNEGGDQLFIIGGKIKVRPEGITG